jgi:type VI secretion system protein ImpF
MATALPHHQQQQQQRQQPALLDRFIVDPPEGQADGLRVLSRKQLRDALLRDLDDLFRTVPALGREWQADPVLAGSVLNYGLPPWVGRTASGIEPGTLEAQVRQAILRFEPRLLPGTLAVRAIEPTSLADTHNVVELEIRGQLWSHPMPIEVLLRTRMNLEAGQVDVRDAGPAPAGPPR